MTVIRIRPLQPAGGGREVLVGQPPCLEPWRKMPVSSTGSSEACFHPHRAGSRGPSALYIALARHAAKRTNRRIRYEIRDLERNLPAISSRQNYPLHSHVESLTLLHDAPIERLKRTDVVRIELGERVDLLCRDVHRSLQYIPPYALGAGRGRYRAHVRVIGDVVG